VVEVGALALDLENKLRLGMPMAVVATQRIGQGGPTTRKRDYVRKKKNRR
jgi:hypothetical protein